MVKERTTHVAAVAGFCFGLIALVLVLLWIISKDREFGRVEGELSAYRETLRDTNEEVRLWRTYVETLRSSLIQSGIDAPALPKRGDHEPGSVLQEEGVRSAGTGGS